MDWFQRHLNWSFFFGVIGLPFLVSMVLFLIFMPQFISGFANLEASGAGESDLMQYFFGTFMQMFVVYAVVGLALTVLTCIVTWWYLGQKARNKWLLLLLLVPFGFIILLLLENQAIGYGGDFIGEPATDYWRPDTGRFGGYDSEQLRELDYRPAKNVEDIAYGGTVKDVGDVGTPGGEVPPPFPPKAPEEVPPEIPPEPPVEFSVEAVGEVPPGVPPPFPPKAPEENPPEVSAQISPEVPVETPPEVSAQIPPEVPVETPPEVPAEIPPEAPVEAAPETRAEIPPEVPPEVSPETTVEFSVEAVDEVPPEAPAGTYAEARVAEQAARPEPLKMPILLDDAGAVIRCFYHPDADAVNLCSRCGQYVCSQCNYVTGTHPICRNCWHRRGEAPIASVGAGAGESAKPGKTEKLEAEEGERLREFMQLYEQAAPIVNAVIKREADGSPSPPLELMEGLKLRPILEQAQKLPQPDGKELQETMKEFEQLLLSCIKVAEAAAGLVSSGEEAVPGEAELTRLSMDVATANGLMQGLSQRLASLSQSPED